MRTFYFDLDGTILDVSQRLCFLYKDMVNLLGGKALPPKIYWEMKREQTPEDFIAKESNIQDVPRYIELRREKIESPEYLKYDELIPNVVDSLLELREDNEIILTTLRKSKEILHEQLHKFKIGTLFSKVLVEKYNSNDGELWRTKARIIAKDECFKTQSSVIVGDTETDILAGKSLNIGTVAVLSGVRSKSRLALSQPDYIIKDINQLKNVLNNFLDRS